MHNEPEAKIRQRAHEMGEGEGRSDAPAERHRLKAEREAAEEAGNAAVSRWAAPVRGTYVDGRNEAAAAAGGSAAEHEAAEEAENAAVARWAAPVRGTYVDERNEAAKIARKAR